MDSMKSMKNIYSQYKVGSAILITFVRSLPGTEKEAAKKLCTSIPDATIYKIFGEHDFAIVRRFDDWPTSSLLSEDLREVGLANERTITCFGWEELDSMKSVNASIYPVVGFCFLNINVAFLNKYGVPGEHDILRALKGFIDRGNRTIKVSVYGTLGWFETVLMIYGNNVADVLMFANDLRQLKILMPGQKDKAHTLPCFDTTITIPAIICENGDVPSNVELGKKISIETRVSCHSWADQYVQNMLSEYLGNPHYVAGTDDFVVKRIRAESLSEYVKQLWSFRQEAKGKVYKTKTSFNITKKRGSKAGLPEVSISDVEKIEFDPTHSKLSQLEKTSPTIYKMFIETYSTLNDLLACLDKRSAITDLIPFAEVLLKTTLDPKTESTFEYINRPVVLGQQLEMLLFGIQQRVTGIEICNSTFNIGPLYIGGAGGIQRVLAALSSIPTSTMGLLHKEWTGFMVFGSGSSYHRYLGGVINMPAETVLHPDLWFGIFHEIGHEYSSQINLIHDPRFPKALSDKGIYTEHNRLDMSELYSEIFSCIFGFSGDFDKCLETTWKYLVTLPGIEENKRSYFIRFLMTYIFILEESGENYIGTLEEFREIAQKLRVKLVKYAGRTAEISDAHLEDICSTAFSLRIPLDIIRDRMPSHRDDITLKRRRDSRLAGGSIIVNLDNPIDFYKRTIRDFQTISFRQAVAIILSLWNTHISIQNRDASQSENG